MTILMPLLPLQTLYRSSIKPAEHQSKMRYAEAAPLAVCKRPANAHSSDFSMCLDRLPIHVRISAGFTAGMMAFSICRLGTCSTCPSRMLPEPFASCGEMLLYHSDEGGKRPVTSCQLS